MDNLTQITDHGGAARLRLYDQHQCGDFADLIEARAGRFQALETGAYDLIGARYLSVAADQLLSDIGAIVGEPRPTTGSEATDDDLYRVRIYARIAINISEGRAIDVYGLVTVLGGGSPRIMDNYPAGAVINYTYSSVINDCACIREILEEATASVSLDITEHTDTPFGFAGDASALGFGAGNIGSAA